MAKSKKEEDVIIDVGGTYSRVEQFVEDNKQTLSYVVGGIVAIVLIYFGYTRFYIAPLEEEAGEELWRAEQYFEDDSLNLALEGDGNYLGFLDIAEEYSGTKAANLANYYIGMCYMKMGEFDYAIDYLTDFTSDDIMVSSTAKGLLGDAYMEVGEVDEALTNYLAAARNNPNEFLTPIYLFKAGKVMESIGDYEEALEVYKEIKADYSTSAEGRAIDKYIARAEGFVN